MYLTVLCIPVSCAPIGGGAKGINADGKRGRKEVTLMEVSLAMLM